MKYNQQPTNSRILEQRVLSSIKPPRAYSCLEQGAPSHTTRRPTSEEETLLLCSAASVFFRGPERQHAILPCCLLPRKSIRVGDREASEVIILVCIFRVFCLLRSALLLVFRAGVPSKPSAVCLDSPAAPQQKKRGALLRTQLLGDIH